MSRVRTLLLPVGLSLPAALSLVLLSGCGSCGEQPAPVPEVVEAPAEEEAATPWPYSWQWAALVHVTADAAEVEVLEQGEEDAAEDDAAEEDAAEGDAAEGDAAEEDAAEDDAAEEPAVDPASALRAALAEAPVAAFRAPAGADLTLTPPARDEGAAGAPVTVAAPALAEGETEAWFLVTDEGTHRIAATDADGRAREARLALGLDPWKIIVGVGVDHAPGQRAGREDIVSARLSEAGIAYRALDAGAASLAVPFDGEGQRALATLDLAGLVASSGVATDGGVFVMAMAGKEPLVIAADPPVMLLRKGSGYFETQLHPAGMGVGQGRGKGMKAGKGPGMGPGKGAKAGKAGRMRGDGMGPPEGMEAGGRWADGPGATDGPMRGKAGKAGGMRGENRRLQDRSGGGPRGRGAALEAPDGTEGADGAEETAE